MTALLASAALGHVPEPSAAEAWAAAADRRITELSQEVESLKRLALELKEQVAKIAPTPGAATAPAEASAAAVPTVAAPAHPVPEAPAPAPPKVAADLLRGMTINALLDGYYGYNTNAPVGRVNYLRAADDRPRAGVVDPPEGRRVVSRSRTPASRCRGPSNQ